MKNKFFVFILGYYSPFAGLILYPSLDVKSIATKNKQKNSLQCVKVSEKFGVT